MDTETAALINYFNSLPDEMVLKIALTLSYDNINQLCLVDTRFRNILCKDNIFWKQKVFRDYGPVSFEIDNWKELYKNFDTAWLIGLSELERINYGSYDMIPLPNIHVFDMAFSQHIVAIIDINHNVSIYTNPADPDDTQLSTIYLNVKAKYASFGSQKSGNPLYLIDMDDNFLIVGGINKGGDIEVFNSNIIVKSISIGENYVAFIDSENNISVSVFNDINNSWSNFNLLYNFKAKQISCGINSMLFIDLNNDLWGVGINSYGELGLGHNSSVHFPEKIPNFKAKLISMEKANHVLAVDIEDNLYTWGENYNGQLGLGDNFDRNKPELVYMEHKAIQIEASYNSSLILDKNNDIWISGWLKVENGSVQDKEIPNNLLKFRKIEYIKDISHTKIIKARKIFNGDESIGLVGAIINK